VIKFIITCFYIGLAKPAPGTWGSLFAVVLFVPIHLLGGSLLLVILISTIFFVGVWLISFEISGKEEHDPGEIVIDELVGQWISLLPISIISRVYETNLPTLWPAIIGGFILFRFFDILKFGPVRWADKQKNSLGVMLDDVFAGVLAAFCLTIFIGLYYAL
jgi:phosphatidylglycerophosphatase A